LSINLFDVVLLVILVGFTLLGLVRGALKEGLSLLGLAVGYWAALSFHEDAGEALTPIVQDGDLAEVLAFLLILGAGYLGGTFLAGATDNMATRTGGPLAAVLAAVFGLGKGLIISISLIWLVNGYIAAFQDQLAGSSVALYLEQALGWVNDIAL
jgi:membrane protein required for colicin V production